MIRTIKLAHTCSSPAAALIHHGCQAQSAVIRIAYNRVKEGQKDKVILDLLRSLPQGQLDSWLTLSGPQKSQGDPQG